MNNNVNQPDGEYWQPELETMPREQLRELQVKKLKQTLEVCLKSPFYKKRLGELGKIFFPLKSALSRKVKTA